MLVAALAPKEGPPLFTAAYDRSRGTIIVVPGAFEPELGRDAELWIVPKDADEPIPVGRLDAAQNPQRLSSRSLTPDASTRRPVLR